MDDKNNFLLESSLKKAAKNINKNQSEANNSAVPDFIQKLFRMLENKAFKDVFCWDPSGTSFLVKDTNEFSRSILPKHFKHCNFASFVRQLNKYDFHKIRSNADENQKLYGDQTWEFEHVNFKRDRKDLLEEIKRKTPGKKKKTTDNTIETKPQLAVNTKAPNQTTTTTTTTAAAADLSAFEDLREFTRELQFQVDQLKRSHVELEETLDNMNKKEQMIMAELSGYKQSLKTKDQLLKECLKLQQQQQQTNKNTDKPVKIENIDNNEWTEQSTIPIESILTDLFLPTPTTQRQENTASVAAAAAQLNEGSLIGSSIKTSEGLTFLALGRLSSNNKDQQPTPAPTTTTSITIDKGKKKMPASWTTPPRVLLVDDDSVYRDVSGRMLNMIGCSIDFAKDGVEALQKMSIEKYDLILMDIVMPKMDGIVTTRNIRRYDALTPIVSMTSNFTHNDIMEYIGIGMNDILPKPFSKSTLYDILEKHCAHLKIMQQQQTSTDPLEIPRSLQSANIMPIMNEPSANYAYDNNTTTTTNNLVNNNTNTPSTASSSTPPNNSPTTTTDTGYWQPLDNRKLVWSSSNASPSTSPSNKHHLHPHHHHHHQQANKKQKLHDLYDTTAPSY